MSANHGHHHQPTHLDLYEGDQSALYSGALAHHGDTNSPESKKQVRRIWMITLYLAIITIAEVAVGLIAHKAGVHNVLLLVYFLVLTILKAALIVKVFMHLGDEKKSFVWFILSPMFLFIWIIIAFLVDGDFWLNMNFTFNDALSRLFSK